MNFKEKFEFPEEFPQDEREEETIKRSQEPVKEIPEAEGPLVETKKIESEVDIPEGDEIRIGIEEEKEKQEDKKEKKDKEKEEEDRKSG